MKKFIILNIFLALFNILECHALYSTAYSNINNRYTRVEYASGINTYSNGDRFNTASKIMCTNSNIGYTSSYGGYSQYGGTYTPANSAGKPGLRRIPVYNGNDTAYTPGGDNDNPDWNYRYDGNDWWVNQGDGRWLQWRGWFFGLTDWRECWRSDMTFGKYNNANEWTTTKGGPPDPNDPFLDPIGDIPPHLLLLLTGGYGLYKCKKRDLRRLQKQKQS